jgi:hypothetical protein
MPLPRRISEFRLVEPPTARSQDRSHLGPYGVVGRQMASASEFEILNSSELALRLKVKESWVVEQSKRSRTSDPIPVFRLGKHKRYRWGSPEMNDWLSRRAGYTTTRKAGSK